MKTWILISLEDWLKHSNGQMSWRALKTKYFACVRQENAPVYSGDKERFWINTEDGGAR